MCLSKVISHLYDNQFYPNLFRRDGNLVEKGRVGHTHTNLRIYNFNVIYKRYIYDEINFIFIIFIWKKKYFVVFATSTKLVNYLLRLGVSPNSN